MGVVYHPLDHADEFELGPWHVRWCGYRQPSNQIVLFGVWVAFQRDFAEQESKRIEIRYWVSCTLGSTNQYRAFDTFDTTFYKEHGSMLFHFSSEADLAAAKREALARLLSSIETGVPFPRPRP